jgi:hypothetical protein
MNLTGLLAAIICLAVFQACARRIPMVDELLIKGAPEGHPPPGLFHIIVEIDAAGRDTYVLTAMTDRALTLDVIPNERKYPTLREVADAAQKLPANTATYAARKDMFRPGKNSFRALTPKEIAELRRLLGQ